MLFTLQILLFIFISCQSLAEYRVFTLHIINKKSQLTKQIETTLDPMQFTTFYPLRADEQITYIETWRCRGRTDFFKAHCNNPRLEVSGNTDNTPRPAAKLD